MIHQPVWLEPKLTQLRVSIGFAPISTDELVTQILARINTGEIAFRFRQYRKLNF